MGGLACAHIVKNSSPVIPIILYILFFIDS